MPDLGYEKAQQDYDAQMPDTYNNPVCKRCGEYEEHLYNGFCISCLSLDYLADLDALSEFAEENFDKFKDYVKENYVE